MPSVILSLVTTVICFAANHSEASLTVFFRTNSGLGKVGGGFIDIVTVHLTKCPLWKA